MLGIFRKTKLRTTFYPREERAELDGEVYIKRPGKTTLKGDTGNISSGGLYLELVEHDLEKGRKVEIVLVTHKGSIKQISRMKGIVIRTDDKGAAMVTYKQKGNYKMAELEREEAMLKQELGEI